MARGAPPGDAAAQRPGGENRLDGFRWLRWLRGPGVSAPRLRTPEELWHSPPCAEARAAVRGTPAANSAGARAVERALRRNVAGTAAVLREVHAERLAELVRVVGGSNALRAAPDSEYLRPDLLARGAETAADRLRALAAVPALGRAREAAHMLAVYRAAGTTTADAGAARAAIRAQTDA
jgi:hypothetical protein